MKFRLHRGHKRFLGLTGEDEPTDWGLQPAEQVSLSPQVKQFLLGRLEALGTYQSGPLFGRRRDTLLTVMYAASAGYVGLQTELSLPFTFQMDEGYVLGWLDALREGDASADWVGQWLIFPDGAVREPEEELNWLRQASTTGLVDAWHVLLIVGLRRYVMELHAYAYIGQEAVGVTITD